MSKVPEGYKQTDLGIIPNDWIDEKFKDVCWVNQGLQIPIEKRFKREVPNSKKYITIQYLNKSKNIEYIKDYMESVYCNEKDILMTRTGNTGYIVSDVDGVFHNNFFKINYNRDKLNRIFLLYFMKEKKFQKLLLAKAGTSTIPDLNHNDFFSLPINYPKLEEQKAIAQVLSDTDNLIQSQEKLISKKKKIKEGTMQQLLTGKKRLDGFSDEWVKNNISYYGIFQGGNGFPTKYQGVIKEKYPFFKVSDMNNEGNTKFMIKSNNYISENIKKLLSIKHFKKDTIVFAKIGAAIFLERKKLIIVDSCVDNNMIGFTLNEDKGNPLFFFYLFHQMKFGNYVNTTALPALNGKDIGDVEKFVPKSLKEQEAIAKILSDMDEDIEVQQQKLNKYQKIKLGMMQQLLTGKIRLIQ